MNLGKKQSPIELFSIASVGAGADSVKRVLGPVLGKEANAILSQLANCKPDLGEYARLAGQAYILQKLLTAINIQLEDAKEASDELRKNWKVGS